MLPKKIFSFVIATRRIIQTLKTITGNQFIKLLTLNKAMNTLSVKRRVKRQSERQLFSCSLERIVTLG